MEHHIITHGPPVQARARAWHLNPKNWQPHKLNSWRWNRWALYVGPTHCGLHPNKWFQKRGANGDPTVTTDNRMLLPKMTAFPCLISKISTIFSQHAVSSPKLIWSGATIKFLWYHLLLQKQPSSHLSDSGSSFTCPLASRMLLRHSSNWWMASFRIHRSPLSTLMTFLWPVPHMKNSLVNLSCSFPPTDWLSTKPSVSSVFVSLISLATVSLLSRYVHTQTEWPLFKTALSPLIAHFLKGSWE